METLEQVKKALQLGGFELFLVRSGIDWQIAVRQEDEDRAWEVVNRILISLIQPGKA